MMTDVIYQHHVEGKLARGQPLQPFFCTVEIDALQLIKLKDPEALSEDALQDINTCEMETVVT